MPGDRCDVLIVGGGPAGSSCAGKLRRAGCDVLVIDKQTFPRDKTCAGWVTPPVIDCLELDVDDYRRERVFQPITGFRTGMIGGTEVDTNYEQPVSFGIRRCEFDDYLLRRSEARCRLGESVKSMERVGNRWIVNGEIEAPILIGAGGHFCPVARKLGARQKDLASVVAAQEIEFEVPADDLSQVHVEAERPELFFCPDLKGYGWCFRKGNFLNVGLGRVDRERLSEHVAEFCEFLRKRGKIECQLPQKFHGHAYQLYERVVPKLVDDGVLLIGDAAGLAYPQSGEGIRPAVESGLLAADVVLGATNGDLSRYATEILDRFGKPRTGGVTDWLPTAWLRFVAARLMATQRFNRRVVLDRWFLHRDVPPLVESGASRSSELQRA